MLTLFFWISVTLAVIDWMAISQDWKRVRWVTRPGMMLALIAWFTQVGRWEGPLAVFGLGLVFSLVGDVLMLFPKRFLVFRMAAVGLTHVFYIAGFNQEPVGMRWETAIPALAVAGAFTMLNRRVRTGIQRHSEAELIVPIVTYAILLSLMWLAALTTLLRPGWLVLTAVMASLGGGLFFLSDSMFAYHRFVRIRRNGELLITITYHLAQICIAGAVLDQFLLI